MFDPFKFYGRVLGNGMKTRFRMVMIAHPGPGIGFHKRFMWRIIIPPTTDMTGWMFFSHVERQSLMVAGEMTLVMVKGLAHLWSSFFMGWSEEQFWRLSQALSPTLYSGAAWQFWL